GGPRAALATQSRAETASAAPAARERIELPSFAEIVALFDEKREAMLHAHLTRDVHLVRCEPGRLEIRPGERAPSNLSNRIGELLTAWTGQRWIVSVSNEAGQATLRDQSAARNEAAYAKALEHPIVKKALAVFPGAVVKVPPPDAPPNVEEPAGGDPGDGAEVPADTDYPADYAGPDEEDFA
ncbi:MAG: DNA polymerase III subunit gamma/tau, partial [Alphaproteobacteria bacterium]